MHAPFSCQKRTELRSTSRIRMGHVTQLLYSIRFYCMGAVGMTQERVLNDNITSAETIVTMMFASMPESLRKIYFRGTDPS